MGEILLKETIFFEGMSALSIAAAEFICAEAKKAVAARGKFSLALSGGNTPRELYQLLAQSRFSATFPWDKTNIFWSDERCVSPDHADSNYHMAFETFLSKISIPKEQVYRIAGENQKPEDAAREYDNLLHNFFDLKKPAVSEMDASFDLTLLGIGPDGHTASLFPRGLAIQEKKIWVISVPAPEGILPRVPRITLTFPIINLSRKILFLASLKDKEGVIASILKTKSDLPAARIQALEGIYFYLQGKPLS